MTVVYAPSANSTSMRFDGDLDAKPRLRERVTATLAKTQQHSVYRCISRVSLCEIRKIEVFRELSSLLTVKTLTGMTTDVYPRDLASEVAAQKHRRNTA